MPEQNTNRALTEAAADEWKVLPSGLTVLVRPMPGYPGGRQGSAPARRCGAFSGTQDV